MTDDPFNLYIKPTKHTTFYDKEDVKNLLQATWERQLSKKARDIVESLGGHFLKYGRLSIKQYKFLKSISRQ